MGGVAAVPWPLLAVVAALAREEVFLSATRSARGCVVSPEVLRYFTVLCMLATIVPYLRACRAFEDGRSTDLRLAAMGHQAVHLYRHLATELTA